MQVLRYTQGILTKTLELKTVCFLEQGANCLPPEEAEDIVAIRVRR